MTFFTKKFRGPDVRMHIRPPNYGVGKPPSVNATYLRFGITTCNTLIPNFHATPENIGSKKYFKHLLGGGACAASQ